MVNSYGYDTRFVEKAMVKVQIRPSSSTFSDTGFVTLNRSPIILLLFIKNL